MTARTILLLALLVLAGGCGARTPAARPPEPPVREVWPDPPAEPRIRYVRTVTGPADAGIRRSFFGRLVDAVVGRSPEALVRPTGIAERGGVLYVADPGAQAVFILDAPGQRVTKVTRVGETRLVSPVAVAPGPDGGVFVADSALKRVVLLGPTGKLVRTIVGSGLERPAAVAFDESGGRLYVADSAGHRIAAYGADGTPALAFGRRGTAAGEFNFPTHLALDRDGALLVTDALNFRVQAFDRTGRVLFRFGRHGDGSGDLASPKGVASDSEGHVYVVDALFDAVQVFDRKGTFLLGVGERGVRPGQFSLPGGIYIGSDDRIYVADSYNRRVQVFEFLPEGR